MEKCRYCKKKVTGYIHFWDYEEEEIKPYCGFECLKKYIKRDIK